MIPVWFRYFVLCYFTTQLSFCFIKPRPRHSFQVQYEWSHLNFTWPSIRIYTEALTTKSYIPENNAPTGMKIYKGNLYLSIPKLRNGVPVALAYLNMSDSSKKDALLRPFPNWQMNDARNCSNLQSIQSMEIDTKGIMWIIDGVRIRDNVNCPSKLIFLDLNRDGFLVHTYIFPNEIGSQNGGFLNDIVIDETDGGYAYITDSSNIDPGLIVYSRKKNYAWKIRDPSMFPDPSAANFTVENEPVENLIPIDGIALSPLIKQNLNRTVFYAPITSLNLFAISTGILKNEELCKSDRWRTYIQNVGKKQCQADGMVVDSKGTLYYTLLPLYGVGSWNIRKPFESAKITDSDRDTMIWPDGFAMDQEGYLYMISTMIFNYFNPTIKLNLTSDVKFRVFRLYTGTRNYLYSDL